MNLQDLKKSIRENTPAIVTAVIVFLLTGFYMASVVPANERKNDNYHKSTLEEFNLQFNNALRDYANQVNPDILKDSIVQISGRLCSKCTQNSEKRFLKLLSTDSGSILKNVKENVIIQSVHIDSAVSNNSEIIIYKRINLEFDPLTGSRDSLKDSKIRAQLCCIRDTSRVDLEDLKQRLNGAIEFKSWVIYSAATRKVFLNRGIEKEELDSITAAPSSSGVIHFKFSDKRFYRQSVSIEGTNINFMLVGAINQEDFDYQSKKININSTFFSTLFVVLLFLSIPLIKPLISSKKEKLTHIDLLSTTCAIGILAIVLVGFAFNTFLSEGYNDIANNSLRTLNKDIGERLNEEFSRYYDAYECFRPELDQEAKGPVHSDLCSFAGQPAYNCYAGLLLDERFQNFFTFNSKGDLVKDISKNEIFGIRRNFSERDYFKVLKEKSYNRMLTAVFSRYDNKFKFVYVAKDTLANTGREKSLDANCNPAKTETFFMSGFAFAPEFMNDIRYNINNGYILCNNTGRVILHSVLNKSLREDIYANSQKNYELSKMLHGMKDSVFEMTYNGEPCLFYAREFSCGGKIDYPLYLLTYKKLSFMNNLQIYTSVNGFMLSLAYVLGITALVLLFSAFFYLGDLSIISRHHLYWMFPDNSRTAEYKLLRWLNFGFALLFAFLFVIGSRHVLYLAFLCGINLAFFNFVLLNQRVFLLWKNKGSKANAKRRAYYLVLWTALILMLGYVIPWMLYHDNHASFGLSLSLTSHFIILYFLKKDVKKHALPRGEVKSDRSNRPVYISYFFSVISYHYILIPILIAFTLFRSEVNIVTNFNYSQSQYAGAQKEDGFEEPAILRSDGKVISLLPFAPPSRKLLEELKFDKLKKLENNFEFLDFARPGRRWLWLFLGGMIVIALLIYKLMNYYSGRFFFFELSEAYRLGYFKPVEPAHSLTNFSIIVPPYSDEDLADLELTEKLNADIPGFSEQLKNTNGDSRTWLKGIKKDVVSNQVKIQMIMMNHFEIYGNQYQEIWNSLTEEEKFVMKDFAADSFVNLKNRNVLMTLMRKGYVIADPLTGRLRVMNYGFRNFIIHLEENDPESAESIKAEEQATKGTYSKWRLPLLIIAMSGIVMFMYLNKESFNNVLFVGGSAISALGLISKFMDTYKQQ
jgi:hypothetical protein